MARWRAGLPVERRTALARGNPEKARARDRARHERMKDDPDYRRRRRAVTTVNNAIRDGKLERGACEECGAPDAHAHHDDYDKPLEVRWLCTIHHSLEHHPEPYAATT